MFIFGLGLYLLVATAAVSISDDEVPKFTYDSESVESTAISGATNDQVKDLLSPGKALRTVRVDYCSLGSSALAFRVEARLSEIVQPKYCSESGIMMSWQSVDVAPTDDCLDGGNIMEAEVGKEYYITALRVCDTGGKKHERMIAGVKVWGRQLKDPSGATNVLATKGKKKNELVELVVPNWLGDDVDNGKFKTSLCKEWRDKVKCPKGLVGVGIRVHYDYAEKEQMTGDANVDWVGGTVTGLSLLCARPIAPTSP